MVADMTMRRQIALEISDFRFIEIGCPDCGSAMTIDVQSKEARPPYSCCGCGARFDQTAILNPVRELIEILRLLGNKAQKVSFRVIVDEKFPQASE